MGGASPADSPESLATYPTGSALNFSRIAEATRLFIAL
jgi:hypothetical protein